MTIRGGGDTRWAMASMPSEECARRPGALPPKRMVLHGPDPTRVQPNTRLRRDVTRPRRAPLRLSMYQTPLSGLPAMRGAIQTRYVTEYKAMPRGCNPEGERALSNAERQARHRARQHDRMPMPVIRYRRPADRRSRAQRWCDAVGELVALQPEYVAWLDTLPDSLRSTPTGEALQVIAELDLDALAAIDPPRGYGRD